MYDGLNGILHTLIIDSVIYRIALIKISFLFKRDCIKIYVAIYTQSTPSFMINSINMVYKLENIYDE